MNLLSCSTKNYFINLELIVDYENKEIRIHIKSEDRKTGVVAGWDYLASEFDKALDDYTQTECRFERLYGR